MSVVSWQRVACFESIYLKGGLKMASIKVKRQHGLFDFLIWSLLSCAERGQILHSSWLWSRKLHFIFIHMHINCIHIYSMKNLKFQSFMYFSVNNVNSIFFCDKNSSPLFSIYIKMYWMLKGNAMHTKIVVLLYG